jgi:hypothetical protein
MKSSTKSKSSMKESSSLTSVRRRKSRADASDVEPDLEKDGLQYDGTGGQRVRTRHNHQSIVAEIMIPKMKVEPEITKEGEAKCPVCKFINKKSSGCRLMTCTMTSKHPSNGYVYYCAYCKGQSHDDVLRNCPPTCPPWFNLPDRLKYCQLIHEVEDDDEDTSVLKTSRESTSSPFTSDESESGRNSTDSDSEYTPSDASDYDEVAPEVLAAYKQDPDDVKSAALPLKVKSEAAARMTDNEDTDIDDSAKAILNYREPDVVKSSTYDAKTTYDETGPTPDAVKSEEVLAKIKSEDVKSSGNDVVKRDGDEGAASSNAGGGEEEDYAALIYQDSQRRKREAAAMAAKKSKKKTAAAASAAKKERSPAKRKRQSVEGEEKAAKTAAKKKYWHECSAEGCQKRAQKGGVCRSHGAKVDKLCSVEGCKNQVVKGGVCARHGAKKENKRCRFEGCTNKAIKGGVCIRHGAKLKRCSSEGCKNQVQKGGVCRKHGAKTKQCNVGGCTNNVIKGGVCWSHGANLL